MPAKCNLLFGNIPLNSVVSTWKEKIEKVTPCLCSSLHRLWTEHRIQFTHVTSSQVIVKSFVTRLGHSNHQRAKGIFSWKDLGWYVSFNFWWNYLKLPDILECLNKKAVCMLSFESKLPPFYEDFTALRMSWCLAGVAPWLKVEL